MDLHVEEEDWNDRELGAAIARGAAIGVPLMFVVAVTISVLADLSLWTGIGVAVLPAFFIGPYVGGLFAMGATSAKHEHAADIVQLGSRSDRLAA